MTDHQCTISLSKDGAHNFVAHSHHDLGDTGAFETRVIRRRLGQARHLVVKIEVSSPRKRDLIAASIDMDTER